MRLMRAVLVQSSSVIVQIIGLSEVLMGLKLSVSGNSVLGVCIVPRRPHRGSTSALSPIRRRTLHPHPYALDSFLAPAPNCRSLSVGHRPWMTVVNYCKANTCRNRTYFLSYDELLEYQLPRPDSGSCQTGSRHNVDTPPALIVRTQT
ncbi:hypothetical protein OBBRIDRAFT_825164 [Obba rivulosa]|uniref:Uncharacterized protein n=1 Tax=Obba rivulosa TaxID=1052685 RepID=A0A8E2B3T4_9APHY|nr:hypothetical protein OBBRIDRAFT_825164 [Obba rivulosa]